MNSKALGDTLLMELDVNDDRVMDAETLRVKRSEGQVVKRRDSPFLGRKGCVGQILVKTVQSSIRRGCSSQSKVPGGS